MHLLYVCMQVGPLPASWSGLSNLKVLGLRNNKLLGALPTSYGKMQNLEYL
jgi:Leucine-rich repeat (LRR) protein